jgi:hypothetical protein
MSDHWNERKIDEQKTGNINFGFICDEWDKFRKSYWNWMYIVQEFAFIKRKYVSI